ncbi:MAG TPA: FAD-dependent oxidoreductase [Jatrophihabitantaceae bacterium]|nr:FAD-dependent oxidoreductase [Jatrophihabitantaceae bacterium]
MTDVDLIVLGLGPGGEEIAERMAEAGWSVLGVDSHLVGGECPYYGCIPSKMIIRGAELLADARWVNDLAGSAEVSPEYGKVYRRIRDEATDDWDDRVAVERLERLGGMFVRGAARFDGRTSDGRLAVEVAGSRYVAPRVVVAVGTAPALPPIDGLSDLERSVDGPVWTNREVVRAQAAPASMVVLGGGPIGIEIGQALGRFGTKVSIVESGERILSKEEPEASDTVADVLRREGADVRTDVKAVRADPAGDGVALALDDGSTLVGDKLLVAVGRRSNVLDLRLDTLGLDGAARTLDVDDAMRVMHNGAPIDGLYCIGDSTGRGAFTHVAVWQARVLIGRLLERHDPFGGYRGLAWVTYSDPEVGRVGLTEAEALEQGITVRTGTAQIASSTRGWIYGTDNDGLVKLVEDAERGMLVGATVVSPHGGEIISLLTLAVHAAVPTSTLASMHYVYPTLHRTVLDAVNDLRS